MKFKKLGRKKPYLESEINKLPCFRCGKLSSYQWNICADEKYHPVCSDCDIGLNKLVLDFMDFHNKEQLLEKYIESKLNKNE
jgi:hypothetical protein